MGSGRGGNGDGFHIMWAQIQCWPSSHDSMPALPYSIFMNVMEPVPCACRALPFCANEKAWWHAATVGKVDPSCQNGVCC